MRLSENIEMLCFEFSRDYFIFSGAVRGAIIVALIGKFQTTLQAAIVCPSRKRNHVFDAVNVEQELQISLEAQSKSTRRDTSVFSQVQVPL